MDFDLDSPNVLQQRRLQDVLPLLLRCKLKPPSTLLNTATIGDPATCNDDSDKVWSRAWSRFERWRRPEWSITVSIQRFLSRSRSIVFTETSIACGRRWVCHGIWNASIVSSYCKSRDASIPPSRHHPSIKTCRRGMCCQLLEWMQCSWVHHPSIKTHHHGMCRRLRQWVTSSTKHNPSIKSGSRQTSTALGLDAFDQSSWPSQSDPNLSATPPGPFCNSW